MFKTKNKFSKLKNDLLLYFIIIIFIIFSSVPINFFSWVSTFPNIALILIFYFMMIKNDDYNYVIFFIFGLLFDIFNNCLLGTTSLALLISAKLINFLRTHLYTSESFVVVLRDFLIFALLYSGMQWIIFSMMNKYSYPLLNSLWQFAINVIFFIILYKLLKKIEKIF